MDKIIIKELLENLGFEVVDLICLGCSSGNPDSDCKVCMKDIIQLEGQEITVDFGLQIITVQHLMLSQKLIDKMKELEDGSSI